MHGCGAASGSKASATRSIATAILGQRRSSTCCAEQYATSTELRFVLDVTEAAAVASGDAPNLDFALASVARVLRLPDGAPLTLFAIGRTIGWIGHAIEQYATGHLIRPRAKYVGPVPAPTAALQ